MTTTLHTARLDLVHLPAQAIRHLIARERRLAESVVGSPLPGEFPTPDDLAGFLPIQLRRMQDSPHRLDWTVRLMVERASHDIVGHCGFHGPPEVIGRAEIGYTVFTAYRGRGFAKEAVQGLIDWAFAQGEQKVFATVAPNNAPSLAVVRAVGFQQIGEQHDEVDGLELVFTMTHP